MEYRGIVAGGSHRAAKLGYPTANIPFDKAVSGIFAAVVTLEGVEYPAVAFADPARAVLEAHLFDFSEDIYGKEITILLTEKVRDAKEFASDEELRAAMTEDAARARALLS